MKRGRKVSFVGAIGGPALGLLMLGGLWIASEFGVFEVIGRAALSPLAEQ